MKMIKYGTFAIIFLAAASILCFAGPADESLAEKAAGIHDRVLTVDTHVDTPFMLEREEFDIGKMNDARKHGGKVDFPRMKKGGLDAVFFAVFVGQSVRTPEGNEKAKKEALKIFDLIHEALKKHPDQAEAALTPDDAYRIEKKGKRALFIGVENGYPVGKDPGMVKRFYDLGARYITLCHTANNDICDSSTDRKGPEHNGLSEFGKKVVKEMNRLGMMIDVSHVSDEAFWQILDLSAAPVIASHSSARHFTPGFERNISDEMILALAEAGGVVQINFGSMFLAADAQAYSSAMIKAGQAYRAEHPELTEQFIYAQFPEIYRQQAGPFPYATLDTVLDHVDHIVGLVGADHVGLGSDFEGVGDSLPDGLKDVSGYPNLVEGLLRRGYSEADIKKILGENLLRVWEDVEAYAATTSSST